MKIAFYKVICFTCWNKYKIPLLPDSAYGEELYFDSKTGEFGYFSWNTPNQATKIVDRFLSENFKYQMKNDDTKGGFARRLIGRIADGDFRILSKHKCPRCKLPLTKIVDKPIGLFEVKNLTFNKFASLGRYSQQNHINEIIKNGL